MENSATNGERKDWGKRNQELDLDLRLFNILLGHPDRMQVDFGYISL